MAIQKLKELDDWQLTDDDQDIRGWEVRDVRGTRIGEVDDLIADTEQETITHVVLDNGIQLPTDDLVLGAEVVYTEISKTPPTPVRPYRNVPVRRGTPTGTPTGTGYPTVVNAFRNHCETDLGASYDDYEDAYRFGYAYGSDENYNGHDFDGLEDKLSRDYDTRFGAGRYGQHRTAIRHAFESARGRTSVRNYDQTRPHKVSLS